MSNDGQRLGLQIMLLILYATERLDKGATVSRICSTLGIARMSFYRNVSLLEINFGVRIEYKKDDSTLSRARGRYVVTDWGCISKKAFLAHIEDVIANAAAHERQVAEEKTGVPKAESELDEAQ